MSAAVQTIYARSPKLRLKGTGFAEIDESDIRVEIGSAGQPLKQGKDFIVMKAEDGIILKLLTSRKWVDLTDRTPPVDLLLVGIYTSLEGKNELSFPMKVANVIETPTIQASNTIIYATATNTLRINGTGFGGAKDVNLYFSPPLYKEIEYELVDFTSNTITLRLRHGFSWAGAHTTSEGADDDETGSPLPLNLVVVGVDTGGGPVKLGEGGKGVTIGTVVNDLESHSVTVANTEEQYIYTNTPTITIAGSGFNPESTSLRFANGLLGNGVNYTTTSITPTSLTLTLTRGSSWRANDGSLPSTLVVVAVNVGGGFVSVGPINSFKGVDVATVFASPVVTTTNTRLFRSHTHELHLYGNGFTGLGIFAGIGVPQLRFNTGIVQGKDFTVKTISRTELEVTLKDGKEWGKGGDLVVTGINTINSDDGWVTVNGGVHVASLVDDEVVTIGDNNDVLEVFPTSTKVYSSGSTTSKGIEITGRGFSDDMTFLFEPQLKEGVDISTTITSSTRARVQLLSKKKWGPAGLLLVKGVKTNGKEYTLAGGAGIRVGIILADPVVTPQDAKSPQNMHLTQSKILVIRGEGFTNVMDIKVDLRPSLPNAYRVLSVTPNTIRLQLVPPYTWLSSFVSLSANTPSIPLTVVGVDTGAGMVTYSSPVVVATVIEDIEGVVCDDSCDFAFDGVCDDGTEEELYYYYDDLLAAGYYADDDIAGGYSYGVEGEDAEGGIYYNYDDYYAADDGLLVSACLKGTDCTDCGGVDAIGETPYGVPESGCTNTCPYARDGQCDDPRGANYCVLGTDCQDCGPVGKDNFTLADDDGWWEDDDDYWSFNDGTFLDQIKGLEHNRHRVKNMLQQDSAANTNAAVVFLTMLEGLVYTIGGIFGAAALYMVSRWYRGESIPFLNVFTPAPSTSNPMRDMEMAPTRRMPITPDVIRT